MSVVGFIIELSRKETPMKLFEDVVDQDVLDSLPESTLDEILDILEKAGY